MTYDLAEEVVIVKVEPADKNRLWMHCRRKNGQRATIKVVDFKPHFYAAPNSFDDPGILYRENGHRSLFGDKLEKIVVEAPGLVPDLRMEMPNPHEAGVPYDQRFIVDTGLLGPAFVQANRVQGNVFAAQVNDCHPIEDDPGIDLHVVDYDLEVAYEEREGMPGKDGQARKPIISIGVTDRHNDTYHNWNYRPDEPFHIDTVELEQGTRPLDCRSFVNDRNARGDYVSGEEQMLTDFSAWVQQRQPDVLSGFNSNGEGAKFLTGFDDRYLLRRCRRKGIRAPFGWNGVTSDDRLSFAGMQLFDVLVAHKALNYLELRRNGLKNLTKEILGYEYAEDMDIMEAYREDPQELIRYNMMDVEATRRIDEKMGYFEWAIYNQWFAQVSKLYDIYYATRRYNSFVLRKARDDKVRIPMRDFSQFDDRDSSDEKLFEGAVVQDPIPGVHENAMLMDLESLYPLMSVAANLSPEMYIPPGEEPDGPYVKIPYVGHRFRTDKMGFLPELVKPALEFKMQGKQMLREATDPQRKKELKNRYIAVKMLSNCFLPGTEIVTANGIRSVRDVSIGDEVYSINPDTLNIEIKPVVATQEEDFSGDMVAFSSRQTDLVVTPNHRMFVERLSMGEWHGPEFMEAEELETGAHRIPCGNPIEGESVGTFSLPYPTKYDDLTDEILSLIEQSPRTRNELVDEVGESYDVVRLRVEFLLDNGLVKQHAGRGRGKAKNAKLRRTGLPTDKADTVKACPPGHKQKNFSEIPRTYDMGDWLQLVAWYVSEGHASHQGRKEYDNGNVRGDSWQIGITQKSEPGQSRIRELLDKTEIPYSFNKTSGQFIISNHTLWRWFSKKCGKGARNKTFPNWILALSPAQRRVFLWTLMEGDGDDHNGFRYRTSSTDLKDQMVHLVVGLGYKPMVRCDDTGCWSVRFSKNKGSIGKRNVTRQPYEGKVYCVTVKDNHTVLAGRDKKFQWCGQSFFGIQGNPAFYLCHIPTVESITAMGRLCSTVINDGVREVGYDVAFGDTDASAPLAKDANLDAILEEGEGLAAELQAQGRAKLADIGCPRPDVFRLEFEKLFGRAIFPGKESSKVKKKYAGLVVAEDGEPCEPYVEITGFESKKADTPEVTIGLQEDVIGKLIAEGVDPGEVTRYVDDIYQKVLSGEIPVKDAAPQPRCKKDPRTHETTFWSYKAAKWSIENLDIPIEPMERFICVPIKDVPAEFALEGNRPTFIALRDKDPMPEGFVPDLEHLADTYVRGKVVGILQAAGLEIGGIGQVKGYRTTRLDDFDEGEGGDDGGIGELPGESVAQFL